MRKKWLVAGLLGWSLLGPGPASAGDSIYGTVTAVESATQVTLEAGGQQIEVRIAGIEAPEAGLLADQARQLVADLVLGENARLRPERVLEEDVMVGRLFTADPSTGIRDVAVELVRAGLARRQQGFDYKYGELAAAEREARAAARGIWGQTPIG